MYTKEQYLDELNRLIAEAVRDYNNAKHELIWSCTRIEEPDLYEQEMDKADVNFRMARARGLRTLQGVERVLDLKPWEIVSTQ